MKTLPLSETNPYLIDPIMRQTLVACSVRTSGGVEGIKAKASLKAANINIPRRKNKKIYNQAKPTDVAKGSSINLT